MTIDDLIDRKRTQKEYELGRRNSLTRTARDIQDSLNAAARGEGTTQWTSEDLAEAKGQVRRADAVVDRLVVELKDLERIKAEDEVLDRAANEFHPIEETRMLQHYDRVARVGSEARTYSAGTDRDGQQFLLDISRSFMFDDPASRERLQRHAAEERVERGQYLERAVGTGAWAGLTVPQYLTDMFAPATAALRPFADNCVTSHPLPDSGMTVNISRVTTSSSVDLQAAENDTVSETDMDDTLLTIPIQTVAGSQTLSRQAVERGTGIEEVTLGDLFARYATKLDATLIGQATTGLDAVAQNTGYTDASPTTLELWPKLFESQNKVETALLAQAFPTHHVMHPRRWNWICSQVSSSFPSVGTGSMPPQLFAQVLTNEYGNGPRAILTNGMVVVTDANIKTNGGAGTNEDVIYTVAKGESHLWEDPNAPMFIRAEQPSAKKLGIDLVVYGYFAYTFGRYANAAGKITGTGLAAPTF